jgi:hypothetical protein
LREAKYETLGVLSATFPYPGVQSALEGTQEVQEVLLLLWSEVVVEIANDPVRFGARAGVPVDGVEELLCAPVMEEEDAQKFARDRTSTKMGQTGMSVPRKSLLVKFQ